MTKTPQVAIVGVAAALGWLATQQVTDEILGVAGVAACGLAGMVVQSAVNGWREQSIRHLAND